MSRLPRTARSRAALTLATTAALIALSLAACGASDESASSAGDQRGQNRLNVVLSTASSDLLVYIARDEGFFKEAGVTVELQENTGANAVPIVTAGKADLTAYTATGALQVAAQNRATKQIYGITGGAIGGVVVSEQGVARIEDLKSLQTCRLGSFPPGSSSYGYAEIYIERLRLDCDIVPLQDNAAIVGALAAGRIDAAVGAYSNFATTIRDRNLRLLVDTRDPGQRKRYVGDDVVENTYWGLESRVSEKRQPIGRFLRALNRARDFLMDPANVDEVVRILADEPAFSTFEDSDLGDDLVKPFRSYVPAAGEGGYIDESEWELALERYAAWGIPDFDPRDPTARYAEVIDMSYLDEAGEN